jgi:hypothetical protein
VGGLFFFANGGFKGGGGSPQVSVNVPTPSAPSR